MNLALCIDLFEAITIFCFGLSWPISIWKSLKSRTAKGKSLFFEVFLLVGYAFGIMRKWMMATGMHAEGFLFYLSFFFYVLNFAEITFDLILYVRNVRLDKLRSA
ncbi:MAG: hypothetical protein E7664_04375 [Ruminococcaceae bacterium]|nr:hypothetical protein [Oscillospiraceae bacterium]